MAVEIHDGTRRLRLAVAPLPDLLLRLVNDPIKTLQRRGVEPAKEVSGGRRVGDPSRSQHPTHGFARLKIRDVFDAGSTREQVIDVGQNVV